MTQETLKELPKIELHCHLDGSLSRSFIEKRLGRTVRPEELSVSENCTSLNEYLEKFDLPGRCIMDEEGLSGAAYDLLSQMNEENVCYAEIRFAPLLSETKKMDSRKVIEAVISGMERGKKDFGIEYGVIICAMRHHSTEDNMRMIKTAREYLGSGVCAADLAGAEALYPMSEFMDIFTETKKMLTYLSVMVGDVEIRYGAFLTAVINFIIMAVIIFLMVKGMNALAGLGKKKEPEKPAVKMCPYCRSKVAAEATRCPYMERV